MRYIPKEIKNNVNISERSPLKELFSLLISIAGILLITYILLGFVVEIIVPYIPEKVEESLGKFYGKKYFGNEVKTESKEKIQKLLNDLVKEIPEKKEYRVSIIESEHFNAFALPGNNIILLSGLLDKIESENELSFVLAHELGHFVHKDHLRGLGRNLVFFVLSEVFLGQESSVSKFIGRSLARVEMEFSQTQEKAADLFALDLLYKKYGHAGGVLKFFNRANGPRLKRRLKAIAKNIQDKNYSVGNNIPLDKFFFKSSKINF